MKTLIEWFDAAGMSLGVVEVPGNAMYVVYDPTTGAHMPFAPKPPAGATLVRARPFLEAPADDDELDHLTCAACDPDGTTSLCGRDVADLEVCDDLPDLCVVCRDLEICPRCGDRLSPWKGA